MSEPEVAFDLFPKAVFPAIYIQLIWIQSRDGHRRIGPNHFICRNIFRTQLEFSLLAFAGLSQAIDCEAKVRKNVVINNVVKEYRVRIERILGQDDAIIKCFIVANGSVSRVHYEHNFRSNCRESL